MQAADQVVASAGERASHAWDTQSGERLWSRESSQPWNVHFPLSTRFSPDGRWVTIPRDGGRLCLFPAREAAAGPVREVVRAMLNPDATQVAVFLGNGVFELCDLSPAGGVNQRFQHSVIAGDAHPGLRPRPGAPRRRALYQFAFKLIVVSPRRRDRKEDNNALTMKQLPSFHLGVSAPLREIILNAMRYWACRADLAEGSQ